MSATAVTLDAINVADAMHRGVVMCKVDTPVAKVAQMMVAHRIHCVVVRNDSDAGGELLWGVVTEKDLVGALATPDLADATAGGIAVEPAITITPWESLQRAARLMSGNGATHLVVVDPGSGTPVGVLSALDLAEVVAARASTA